MPDQAPYILRRLAAPLLCTLFLALHGCASSADQQGSSAATRSQAREVFGTSGGEGQPGALADAGWSIVLAAFTGPDARQRAGALADLVRQRTDLPSIRVQDRGRGVAVVSGAYRSPSDADAQRDLDRARAAQIDGQAPFQSAFLAPPSGKPDPGATPQFHLSRARTEFGNQSRYTLQVAVYESPNPAEARRAAEQAAAQLRAEGLPAFYYHGPSRSMVTLGAFTAAEAGLDTGLPSPLLADLQRRHPYNLFNGRQLLQRVPGQRQQVPQPSFLVEIPKD